MAAPIIPKQKKEPEKASGAVHHGVSIMEDGGGKQDGVDRLLYPQTTPPRNCEREVDFMSEMLDDAPTGGEDSILKRRKAEEEAFQKTLRTRQMEFLAKKTHFTFDEIRALMTIFNQITSLARAPGRMDRQTFRKSFAELFGVTNSMMLDHTYSYYDITNDGMISPSEWIINLSVLLRGSFDEQIEYCYRVYDLDGDEAITRAEVMSLVQGSMLNIANYHAEDDDGDRVTELTDMLMRKLDTKNGNGLIPLRKFRRAVKHDPMLVQCLGPCLAEPRKMQAFLATITENFVSFSTNYTTPPDRGCSEYENLAAEVTARNRERKVSFRGDKPGRLAMKKRFSTATISTKHDKGKRWERHVSHSQRKRQSLSLPGRKRL